MSQLPPEYLSRMEKLLGYEYPAFINSYQEASQRGLRVNTLKLAVDRFLEISPFPLSPVPWAKGGFYYRAEDKPGKHPYHAAGLYYLQEPSAMAVAAVLAPKPGERVLDLCAAPGGKSTHLAAMMAGEGLLWANEIHPARARILAENLERFGVRNTVVTNEHPERLVGKLNCFFDRVLVDAPCSGEGMFRKEPEACSEWQATNITMCAKRQLAILNSAAQMLRAGGLMAYSTCTFSPEENEGVIEQFLQNNPDFNIENITLNLEFSGGVPEWVQGRPELSACARLWPHKIKGEGHFIALLSKAGASQDNYGQTVGHQAKPHKPTYSEYYNFATDNFKWVPEGEFVLFGDNLYILPSGIPDLGGIKVVRPGWHLGMFKKKRFEPSQAMALSMPLTEFRNALDFQPEDREVKAYLKGESLMTKAPKGWIVISVNGYPLGWGKSDGSIVKNHYPKGLRQI